MLSDLAHPSVAEVADPGRHQRNTILVAALDRFAVAQAAAWVGDGSDSCATRNLDRIVPREREERIARQNSALLSEDRRMIRSHSADTKAGEEVCIQTVTCPTPWTQQHTARHGVLAATWNPLQHCEIPPCSSTQRRTTLSATEPRPENCSPWYPRPTSPAQSAPT